MSALTSCESDAEMIWGKLHIHNQKPLHICSIISLKNCLSQLHTEDSENSPCLLVGGDFNFPDISWQDGYGHINPSPTYGTDTNKFFVDTINDHGLEQLISAPTRGNNILDLLLCSHPSLISNVEITPGISDHDAILYCFELPNKPLHV